jgi:hypothetical protein
MQEADEMKQAADEKERERRSEDQKTKKGFAQPSS